MCYVRCGLLSEQISTVNSSHSIDTFVGQQLRRFRLQKGLSQSALGAFIDVTFQQIQKYERGVNRVSAGHLHAFAEALGTNVASFFPPSDGSAAQGPEPLGREHLEAIRLYAGIRSDEQRRLLRQLMRTMGDAA